MKVESRMNKRYGLLNRPRVTGEGYEASKMEESRAEMLRDAAFVVGPSGVTREINVLGMGLQASSFKLQELPAANTYSYSSSPNRSDRTRQTMPK